MDAKLVNPFIDALMSVMPQMGFPVPKRVKMGVRSIMTEGMGVAVLVGFTKQIRGNVVYNMTEDTAKYIASTMMMGMAVDSFDAMAQSAIAEMSNMLTANAATSLAGMGYEVDISTPSLTIGTGCQIRISQEQYLFVEMDVGSHVIELGIAVQ